MTFGIGIKSYSGVVAPRTVNGVSVWYAPSWTQVYVAGQGMVWVNTPLLSVTDLLLNPDFEGTYVSGVAPSWAKTGTPTPSESSDFYSGAKSQELTASSSFSNSVSQVTTAPANLWYRYSAYVKRVSGTGTGRITWSAGAVMTTTSDSYAQLSACWRPASANPTFYCYGSAVGDVLRFDFASLKQIITASLFATRFYGSGVSAYSVPALIIAGHQGGLVSWLDNPANPQNYLQAWINLATGKIQLDKVVGGTLTAGIVPATTITYVAWKVVEIKRTGVNTFQLWYDGVQIGSDATVSDAEIIGNSYFGLFSTDPVVQIGQPTATY